MNDIPEFKDRDALVEFMLGGRAVFTVISDTTGRHITYKLRRLVKTSDVISVSYHSSQNMWIYLGSIFERHKFKATRKTAGIMRKSDQFISFEWLWEKLIYAKRIPRTVKVYHTGKCGMCGRSLSDPISITEGLGPECRTKLLRHDAQIKGPTLV